jgi:hypothetical protein
MVLAASIGRVKKIESLWSTPKGKVFDAPEIEHSALGWKKFRGRIKPYGSIPFAIATNR